MSKKTWIYIAIGVVLLIVIIYFATKSKTPAPIVVSVPTQVPSNQPTNNIAQIIAALGGLSTAIGGWGIFGSGDSTAPTGG